VEAAVVTGHRACGSEGPWGSTVLRDVPVAAALAAPAALAAAPVAATAAAPAAKPGRELGNPGHEPGSATTVVAYPDPGSPRACVEAPAAIVEPLESKVLASRAPSCSDERSPAAAAGSGEGSNAAAGSDAGGTAAVCDPGEGTPAAVAEATDVEEVYSFARRESPLQPLDWEGGLSSP